MQSSGVLGFDRTNDKLVGKSFNRIGTADSEWAFSDGKLIEKITLKEKTGMVSLLNLSLVVVTAVSIKTP